MVNDAITDIGVFSDEEINILLNNPEGDYQKNEGQIVKLFKEMGVETKRTGKLYQVELAPKEDEYLLWDRPLSEQSEKVKAAFERSRIGGTDRWH